MLLFGMSSCRRAPETAERLAWIDRVVLRDDRGGGKSLTAVIGARSEAAGDLEVTVYRYVRDGAGNIVLANEDVVPVWKSMPVDWQGSGVELLEVPFPQTSRGAFYGFALTVSCAGKIVASHFEPPALEERFAAKLRDGSDLPTAAETAELITTFSQAPLSLRGRAAAAEIVRFAKESPDHEVALRSKVLPWLRAGEKPQHSELLLAAFVAGDLREQLRLGRGKSQPYAGAVAMIEIYRKIQAKEKGYRVEAVDRLVDLEKEGQLKPFVEAE